MLSDWVRDIIRQNETHDVMVNMVECSHGGFLLEERIVSRMD